MINSSYYLLDCFSPVTRCMILAMTLLAIGCKESLEPPALGPHLNSGACLDDPEEFEYHKKLSLEGDKESTFKIYWHYELCEEDAEYARLWLVRAAELDHPTAQYNLGQMLIHTGVEEKISLGEYYLKRAAENGHEGAVEELSAAPDGMR